MPTDVANACTGATCIPTSADGIPSAVRGTGTTGALPFTGVGDMIAPVLLALTVLLGGVVAWRWAQLRESVARDADRAIETPARTKHTGYQQSLRRTEIEGRARSVFQPRVA
ncbi:MAG: hypothetical protein H7287_13745 [Thermoleophilia bacterium]|nr:hypothetical protein [Thermoleophilia bacterium]